VIFTPLVGPAIDLKIIMKTALRGWIKMVKNLNISYEKFLKSEEKLK
jgi:hypothetical protein